MCLISFALGSHERYPLVLVANRDEFFKRPAEPMSWWKNNLAKPTILAGRDEAGGGTWFGINEAGRWAAVTNYREPHTERDVRTRGELVTEFLFSDVPAADYLQNVKHRSSDYNGFNLLVGQLDEVYWFSNRAVDSAKPLCPLNKGVYGLSNHLLDTPWPKVELARNCLAEKLASDFLAPEQVVLTLHNESRPDDSQLPETGVDLETERMLSSMFIEDQVRQYGTRCSTALTISVEQEIKIAELTFPERSMVQFSFSVAGRNTKSTGAIIT